MIKYDKEAKKKYPNLTGWWVLFGCDKPHKITAHYPNCSSSQIKIQDIYGNVFVDENRITHLLGVDKPMKLHPQQVADITRSDVILFRNAAGAKWYNKKFVDCIDLIEPYDEEKHETRYYPRPVYEGKTK